MTVGLSLLALLQAWRYNRSAARLFDSVSTALEETRQNTKKANKALGETQDLLAETTLAVSAVQQLQHGVINSTIHQLLNSRREYGVTAQEQVAAPIVQVLPPPDDPQDSNLGTDTRSPQPHAVRERSERYGSSLMDRSLMKVLGPWREFPANFALLAAIYREKLFSVDELLDHQARLGLVPSVEIGVDKMLREQLLVGDAQSFKVNPALAGALDSWVEANEPCLSELAALYADGHRDRDASFRDRARELARELVPQPA